ncbi:NAD(P)-dependent alcohol dehydrogenase [uncultured Aquimarina sp.]|uniref:NAD(P)-dependent alcohol dehydrogenase n=1 Tax=uncultured Aquimarina sp. TaxID=575652 RepID=UPI002630729C|nr:NAD(P)-dependent alcohol dehydrogenase [uncultured Aquimarina sp.]
MKAVIYKKYGGPNVLQLKDVPKPVIQSNEVLIKIIATSVTAGDVRLRASNFPPLAWLPARLIFGLFTPKKQILGHEFSGHIVQVGDKVTRFKTGDEVYGTTSMLKTGAYAEFIAVPECWKQGALVLKPTNIDFKEAAILPIGAMTALYLLKKANTYKDKRILIYGASGSVGSYAVQIAKSIGADVTGVCSSRNIEMVASLGADTVIDYTKEDFTKSNKMYDIIFDAVGKLSKVNSKTALLKGGKYVTTKMITKQSNESLEEVKTLVEQQAIRPFIDKTYALEDIQKAHAYVDTGRKRGNISIII